MRWSSVYSYALPLPFTFLRKCCRPTGWPTNIPCTATTVGTERCRTRDIFYLWSADHITDALATLHWLRVSEWIEYKIALPLLTFRVLHGSAPPYLGLLVSVHSLPGRRSLRSTGTNRLLVPPIKRSTVGSRAFPVASPKTWNALPDDVASSQVPSLNTPFTASSKRGFSRSLLLTSSSDTDCILTFNLGLSVPTLRRFCCLRTTMSTIWYGIMIWCDVS